MNSDAMQHMPKKKKKKVLVKRSLVIIVNGLFILQSTAQLGLSHETSTEEGKEHNDHHEAEALVSRPAIAAAHNVGNIRVELLDIVETFSHSIDDRLDIFAVLEFQGQSLSKELLDHR